MTDSLNPFHQGPSDRSFLSVLAHELRTPLTSVVGLLALLEEGSVRVEDAEAKELASMGRTEAERMLLIIENLLAATWVAQGRLEPDTGAVRLPGVVRDALAEFPDVARRTFVPLDREAVVEGDRRLVAQIVSNLIQNVSRYAPDGEVEVRFDCHEGVVSLSVADDGPGIPPGYHSAVFDARASERGLGVGLGISRDLARAMGGDLVLAQESFRSGATFILTLPASQADEAVADEGAPTVADEATSVLPPSARLLVDMTEVLADRSLDRLVAGLQRMFADLLGAESGCLMVTDRSGNLKRAGGFGIDPDIEIPESAVVRSVLEEGRHVFVADLPEEEAAWSHVVGARSGLFLPVLDEDAAIGVLVIGWDATVEPSSRVMEIATALARLASFGAQRAALVADVAFERGLRSSVLEAFPIAVSVFAGDPPQVIDWNAAERKLLGICEDDQRPPGIVASQNTFDVRFIDGTPLTLETAPVTQTIRTGKSSGPFLLRVRRADGSEIISRTYCAPFFDDTGAVAGAVVSSEDMGASGPPADLA